MEMKNPEMQVVRFDAADVIATSGGLKTLTLTLFGDGQKGNGVFSFDNNDYNYNSSTSTSVISAMNAYFCDGGSDITAFTTLNSTDGLECTSLSGILQTDYFGDDEYYSFLNKTYEWHVTDGGKFIQKSN